MRTRDEIEGEATDQVLRAIEIRLQSPISSIDKLAPRSRSAFLTFVIRSREGVRMHSSLPIEIFALDIGLGDGESGFVELEEVEEGCVRV